MNRARLILRLLVGTLLLTLTFAGGYAVTAHKTVTLTSTAPPMTVTTMKSRVIDVVQENGFDVGDRDDLYPAADQTVAPVRDHRAAPQPAAADLARRPGQHARCGPRRRPSTRRSAQLQMTDTAPAAASRGSRVPLAGMSLPVVSAKTVQINDGGVVRTVRLAAPNVAGLLEAAGVPLQQSDTVVPAASSPVIDGMQIQVTRIRIEKVTERHAAGSRPTSASRTSTMNMSRQVVEDPGTPGTQDVTFAVAKVNGVETGRLPVANVVITPARDGVLRVGAKPGTEVPPVSNGGHMGRACRSAKPVVIGPSTPATVSTAACNLIKTPGSATAV